MSILLQECNFLNFNFLMLGAFADAGTSSITRLPIHRLPLLFCCNSATENQKIMTVLLLECGFFNFYILMLGASFADVIASPWHSSTLSIEL
jgi:hypothetical protein